MIKNNVKSSGIGFEPAAALPRIHGRQQKQEGAELVKGNCPVTVAVRTLQRGAHLITRQPEAKCLGTFTQLLSCETSVAVFIDGPKSRAHLTLLIVDKLHEFNFVYEPIPIAVSTSEELIKDDRRAR